MERWEQDPESLTGKIDALQTAAASDQSQLTELHRAFSKMQSEKSALKTQLDVTRSMAIESDKQQHSILKALSAEFTLVVREARSVEQKSQDTL